MATGQRAHLRPTGPGAHAILAAILAAVVGVALAGCAQPNSAPSVTAVDRQTYLQFNLCGNACNRGGPGVITDVRSAVEARRPAAVTLNEVCQNQYADLERSLSGYAGRFDPTGPHCRNGSPYGNAILVRPASTVDLIGSWELPNPAGDETRRLMCVRAELSRDGPRRSTAVCVTHISNEAGNVGPQVSAVADLLRPLTTDVAVLLGGDFNADPADAQLDPLYRACDGSGLFREADSTGCADRSVRNQSAGADVINEDTYGSHKFDYIFLSEGGWTAVAADATGSVSGLSDHKALWATLTLH